MYRVFLILLAATIIPFYAQADISKANQAYQDGDYATAFEEFFIEAQNGNSVAQYRVALMYIAGQGTEQDSKVALEWLERAAENGHAESAMLAGDIYTNDPELANFRKAHEQYASAVDLGLLKAAYPLGKLYTEEKYARVNMKSAVSYFEIAANDPDGGKEAGEAAYFLARIYRGNNTGIISNEETALEWLEVAAENGQMDAAAELGSKYLSGNGIPKNYRKALKFTETAAQKGHPASQFNLGVIYYEGRLIEKDLVKALTWFMVARNSDPALDNGTIEKFTQYLKATQTKEAEEEAARISAAIKM